MIVELFRVITSLLSDLSGSYGIKIWQEKKMLSDRRPSHTQGGVNDVGFTPQGGDNDVGFTPRVEIMTSVSPPRMEKTTSV